MPTTTNAQEAPAMSDFSTITPGTLPRGTVVPVSVARGDKTGTITGEILRASLTAYLVLTSLGHEVWLPFATVHGRPAPVEPLVVLR